jgi:hypothetical protein
MAKFTTYYETRSHMPRFTTHSSKAAATKRACEISVKTGGYVTVLRNGIEVAACRKGKRI